ncbi:hypothetical protein HOLleu_44620 [Holothuria leucospilota]|uniref:Uncharacterized protein n=1 Tax=Holothuria leucospilota TaxID=206669 RepID=A0A9Q0YAJ3_HOLLE|nr:hypothetical protein HOLleu_44620 [Holothuria leucospilota]
MGSTYSSKIDSLNIWGVLRHSHISPTNVPAFESRSLCALARRSSPLPLTPSSVLAGLEPLQEVHLLL